jgi:hypothetical protein
MQHISGFKASTPPGQLLCQTTFLWLVLQVLLIDRRASVLNVIAPGLVQCGICTEPAFGSFAIISLGNSLASSRTVPGTSNSSKSQ